MKELTIAHIAKELRDAYITKQPIEPIRHQIGTDDVSLAYQIQDYNNQLLLEKGARIVGRKIGLTSKIVQQQFGITKPDYGLLLNTMEVLNGGSIAASAIVQPKVEGEIALVLGKDLPNHPLTIVELIQAIDYAVGSIEIVGSRIKNWDIKITDTIADNASASHFVIGHRPRKLTDIDLVNCEMTIAKKGEVVSKGQGSDCLGSPLNAALWLANKMSSMQTPLKAGEVILTGALGKMVNVAAGDTFVADFGALGQVSVHFD